MSPLLKAQIFKMPDSPASAEAGTQNVKMPMSEPFQCRNKKTKSGIGML